MTRRFKTKACYRCTEPQLACALSCLIVRVWWWSQMAVAQLLPFCRFPMTEWILTMSVDGLDFASGGVGRKWFLAVPIKQSWTWLSLQSFLLMMYTRRSFYIP